MFIVAFGWDRPGRVETVPGDTIQVESLEAAQRARQVSGDLVFNAETKQIVQGDAWLFSWERQTCDNYAKRKQEQNVSLVFV